MHFQINIAMKEVVSRTVVRWLLASLGLPVSRGIIIFFILEWPPTRVSLEAIHTAAILTALNSVPGALPMVTAGRFAICQSVVRNL